MIDTAVRPSLEGALAVIQRRWPELSNDCREDPVFVLAAGWRSGSTLLQRMLMPSCFVWGEPYGHAGLIEALAEPIRCFHENWPEPQFFYGGEKPRVLSRRFIANLYPLVQDLLTAQQQFFQRLFARPARSASARRWGIKEVRLTADHAVYLKWLFPQAKFLFLYRNPYDAYRSYAARKAAGWEWYKHWPDEPLTTRCFGRHWRELVRSFVDGHRTVDGLLIRFEDLVKGELQPMADYLGFKLSSEALKLNPSDGGPPALARIPDAEREELEQEVGELATSLGYRPAPSIPAVSPTDTIGIVSHSSADPQQRKTKQSSRCAVLVPVAQHVEVACDAALRQLESRGYEVFRVPGSSAIDQARNQLASEALAAGFDELMWIDADVVFEPEAVDRLRAYDLPLVCCIYPKKGRRELACEFLPGTDRLTFGRNGGLVELAHAGFGFMFTRRAVYEEMQRQLQLPVCDKRYGKPTVPYFLPMVATDKGEPSYLAEDYAFCQRARDSGFRLFADTSIRLWHVGAYGYSWEDAGSDKERYASYNFQILDGTTDHQSLGGHF